MKNRLLVIAIILFIILIIPFFQNLGESLDLAFYRSSTSLLAIYLPFMLACMTLGAIVTLYIQKVIQSIKDQTKRNKFELS